jgi:hypothetical protein
MSMATYRVIGPNGQKFGPVDLETLNMWAAQSRVTPDMEIESVEDGKRTRAANVPGLTFAPPVANPGESGQATILRARSIRVRTPAPTRRW